MNCRHCGLSLRHVFLDLGFAPPSNAYLTETDLQSPEIYLPLKLYVCENCWLVQTEDYAEPDELFRSDYAYFSSVSKSWLAHAQCYSEMITQRLQLSPDSFVVEVASNDGYLLKNFVSAGIPCLGIEPTDCTAQEAERVGVPVLREFFGVALAERLVCEGKQADLIVGNNVYAHVPDINDFTAGLKKLLKPGGTVTLEFPHLLRLIEFTQFDTVYHEHFSYLSLHSVARIFSNAGLRVLDVEELPTHGGSLRVYAGHVEDRRGDSPDVARILAEEERGGLTQLSTYHRFQDAAERVKNELLMFLLNEKTKGRRVAAYGAAAKGNTLLNFAGVKPDLLPYICDAAPSKQQKFTPGGHIPIIHPSVLSERKPDTVLILPWNLADEIMETHNYIREWGGKFVVAIPGLRVLE